VKRERAKGERGERSRYEREIEKERGIERKRGEEREGER
jgi:hypothetical protein